MPLDVQAFEAGRVAEKASPPRILYAGNLLASKGVEDLIRAFAILRGRGVDCRLRILGEGPERESLQEVAATLGIGDGIDWSGFLPQQAMPAEYASSSVVVLPTRGNEEGLGLTLVEALLAGTAVVGTRAGGIPEIVIDGETGLLAHERDPTDLADKLSVLLTDPDQRAKLAEQGHRHVRQRFDPNASVDAFLDLLQRANGRHSTR